MSTDQAMMVNGLMIKSMVLVLKDSEMELLTRVDSSMDLKKGKENCY